MRFVGLFILLLIAAATLRAEKPGSHFRVAVFNIHELGRTKVDQVDADGKGVNRQLVKAAEIIQRHHPDILLINEIDYDFPPEHEPTKGGQIAQLFHDRYLKIPHNGQTALNYPHIFTAPVNTGVRTRLDMNNDGKTDGPEDAYGYGAYPGQYGMALYSRFPIDEQAIRTFRMFLWKDMPGHLIPDGADGRPAYYNAKQIAIFRLSSKSHWDVPVKVGDATVHLLCSHPTPPVFDGPEDRNGRRNHDEIRLWADYLTGGERSAYLRDDAGKAGGLPKNESVIVMGDLNAEPVRGDRVNNRRPIELLLQHPRLQDPKPTSEGGVADEGPDLPNYKPYRTHGFGRLDYLLPSKNLTVRGAGIFWPKPGDPLRSLIDAPDPASDHRLVWLDVIIPSTKR